MIKKLKINNFFFILFLVNGIFFKSHAQIENENTKIDNSNYFEIKEALRTNDPKKLFQPYKNLIYYYNSPDTIHKYADLIQKIAFDTQNQKELIYALQAKSYASILERDYTNSLNYELEAISYIDKIDDPYQHYSSLYNIALIRLNLSQFKEALEISQDVSNYFKDSTKYNDILGYLNSKRLEAICYYYLEEYKNSLIQIQNGLEKVKLLDKTLIPQEVAYFNLTKAMVLYQKNNFEESIKLLKSSLIEIKKNKDFANEVLAYLYLGQNEWSLNNKDEAIIYFKKIDEIFNSKKFISLEVYKTYNYLIEYSKENINLKDQLDYTNKLLEVSTYLQKNQTYLSKSFLVESEKQTNLLLKSKVELQEKVVLNKRNNIVIVFILVICFSILFGIIFIIYRKTIKLKSEYEKVVRDSNSQFRRNDFNLSNTSTEIKNNNLIKEKVKAEDILSKKTINDFNRELIVFEKENQFLESNMSLNVLAERWNTNRSYISKYFNDIKGETFNNYINTLRINYAVKTLKNKSIYRKYSIDALASEFGFNQRRHFTDVFIKITGISPSSFIEKINLENSDKK